MRYSIRRISLFSALRLGCALGWLIALVPAIVLAGLLAFALDRIARLFAQIQPITLTVLGQEILRLDLLSRLGLQGTANTVSQLTANPLVTFILLSLLLLVFGGMLVALTFLLGSAGYNLLAWAGGGLEMDLIEAGPAVD